MVEAWQRALQRALQRAWHRAWHRAWRRGRVAACLSVCERACVPHLSQRAPACLGRASAYVNMPERVAICDACGALQCSHDVVVFVTVCRFRRR